MLRFAFISKRNAALSTGPNYTRCSYDTETVVAFKPRSSNGIHCVSLVAFSKVPLWIAFSKWNIFIFMRFRARFHRFHVNETCICKENSRFQSKTFPCKWGGTRSRRLRNGNGTRSALNGRSANNKRELFGACCILAGHNDRFEEKWTANLVIWSDFGRRPAVIFIPHDHLFAIMYPQNTLTSLYFCHH